MTKGKRVPLPAVEPAKVCAQVCFDCPFRKDAAAYQTAENAAANLHWTLTLRHVPQCHHSVKPVGLAALATRPPDVWVKCAGAVVFMRRAGVELPAALRGVRLRGGGLVVSGVAEFARLASLLRTEAAKSWYWWALQPAHRRAEIAADWRKADYPKLVMPQGVPPHRAGGLVPPADKERKEAR